MARIAVIAIGVLLAVMVCAGLGFMWWSHQMYTVGMDVNLKAMLVTGVVVFAVGCVAIAMVWLRGRRSR